MDREYTRKIEVAQQFREAAWRIGREAKDMGVGLPGAVSMVLKATDRDFLVAQHRGATSPEVVEKEIEKMECTLDELARQKLAAIATRDDNYQEPDHQVHRYQNSSGAVG